MLQLARAFFDIMLHRRGPEDLPSSKFLVWLLLAVAVVVDIGILIANDDSLRAAAVALLIQFLDLWFVWALLRTFNHQRRFPQTMSALLGTETILNLIAAPLVLTTDIAAAPAEQDLTLPLLLMALLGIWSIDIAAYVFSRALQRPYVLCVAIMLGYVLLIVSLQTTLLPRAS